MVLFGSRDTHGKEVLKALNKLRQEPNAQLSDVTLLVSGTKIKADKWVLVAASDYFRSLLVGSFKESSMSDIDLSAVTTDFSSVDSIVDFIYTGEIEINEANVGSIVKLGSYFLIESLQKFCVEFMLDTLNRKNCLAYYILSVSHGLQYVEEKAASVLETRFHDHVLFTQNLIQIPTGDISHLLSKGYFKFCSIPSIISFISKWLEIDTSDKHMVMANALLENLTVTSEAIYRVGLKFECRNCIEKLNSVVKKQENDNTVSARLVKKLLDTGNKLEEAVWQSSSPTEEGASVMENVVLTLSPRQVVVQKCKEILHTAAYYPEFPEKYTEGIFDMCLFVPSQNQWYYLKTVYDEHIFSKLLRHGELYFWRYACVKNSLAIIVPEDDHLYIYNLKDFLSKSVAFDHLLESLPENEHYAEYCSDTWLTVHDEVLYLVLNIKGRNLEEDEMTQQYNLCYKLDASDNWIFICSTPKFATNEEECNIYACVSGSDMLILFDEDLGEAHYCCTVDLSKDEPEAVLVDSKTGPETNYFGHCAHILTDSSHFYVVCESDRHLDKMEYSCKSVYNCDAKTLTPCNLNGATAGKKEVLKCLSPCESQVACNDGKTIWNFSGNVITDRSQLEEIVVGDDRCLLKKEHIPPPFSSITAAIAGKVDLKQLKLTPVTEYLTS